MAKKKIQVIYSSTNEKTIEEVIRNLIKSHKNIKNYNIPEKAEQPAVV